jgi:hypothetical protein
MNIYKLAIKAFENPQLINLENRIQFNKTIVSLKKDNVPHFFKT